MTASAGDPLPQSDAAAHRIGEPSPLIFHMFAALIGYQQALLAAPKAHDDRFPWAPHLRDAARALDGEPDRLAVAREIGARLSTMVAGLERWQTHPYRRSLADPPVLWSRGSTRLLDYGQVRGAAPEGRPLLVVPSLINRAYVLDLMPERTLLRWLAARGFRPLLLDWGEPGVAECGFGIAEYGSERLLPAMRALREGAGGPVPVLGYCMGGTLAAGLAARLPEDVAALVTIGAPWNFDAHTGLSGGLRAMLRAEGPERVEALLEALGEAFGAVPVLLLQTLFALVNPMQMTIKFQRFARLPAESRAARHFVALEDWVADGVPMATRAAIDLLVDWQIRNRIIRGGWSFLGGTVRADAIRAPTLAFCGQTDSIAPLPISRALPEAVPGARMIAPPTGHVGMVAGSAAPAQVWRPLADFLDAHRG